MLFGTPNLNEMSQWTGTGFLEDNHSVYLVFGAMILLVKFWQQFVFYLLFEIPGKILEFYRSYPSD